MVISDVRRWLQQCWDSEIVWEWECCIVNLIIILLWRNIRELVSAGVRASDQSVDHVWPSFAGPEPRDETEPARIDNEPGVATAECAEPTVDTSHTADTRHWHPALQCCSQLLQITLHTHITRADTAVRVRRVHPGRIIIQETIGHQSRDVRRLFILFPWPNWVPELMLTSAPSLWPVLRSLWCHHCLYCIISPSLSSSSFWTEDHYYCDYPALAILILWLTDTSKHAITKLGHKMTESHQPIKTSTAVLKAKRNSFYCLSSPWVIIYPDYFVFPSKYWYKLFKTERALL